MISWKGAAGGETKTNPSRFGANLCDQSRGGGGNGDERRLPPCLSPPGGTTRLTFCRREANKPLSCCTRFKHTVGAGPTPLAPTPPPPPSSESSVSSACQNRCTRDPPPPPRRDPASGPRSDPPATFLSTRPCFSSKIPLKRAHARPWSPPRPETEGGAAPLCFILRDPHHGSAVLNTTSPPLLIPPSPSPLHPFTPSSPPPPAWGGSGSRFTSV